MVDDGFDGVDEDGEAEDLVEGAEAFAEAVRARGVVVGEGHRTAGAGAVLFQFQEVAEAAGTEKLLAVVRVITGMAARGVTEVEDRLGESGEDHERKFTEDGGGFSNNSRRGIMIEPLE